MTMITMWSIACESLPVAVPVSQQKPLVEPLSFCGRVVATCCCFAAYSHLCVRLRMQTLCENIWLTGENVCMSRLRHTEKRKSADTEWDIYTRGIFTSVWSTRSSSRFCTPSRYGVGAMTTSMRISGTMGIKVCCHVNGESSTATAWITWERVLGRWKGREPRVIRDSTEDHTVPGNPFQRTLWYNCMAPCYLFGYIILLLIIWRRDIVGSSSLYGKFGSFFL